MEREELLLSRLIEYGKSTAYPFHMPGHKRQVQEAWPGCFPNPFSVDITEIDGFDNLHHAEGILKQSMEWAAKVYGADKTYYLVNGSSGGILSAICAVTRSGGTLLMSRNCHKSVYHGVILNQLEAEYVYPQIMSDLGIQGGIRAEDVENALEQNPGIQAVLIVSPTYDGVVSDVRRIAEIVHEKGIPLIVDEAHGAHFPFGGTDFPESAIACGADLIIQSLHKTLPSLTQTAVLHMRTGLVDEKRLERYLQMFQSSSPSYVFMAGMEACIYEMEQHGRQRMQAFAVLLREVRKQLFGLRHLRLLGAECIGASGVYDLDRSKLVVSCRGCVIGTRKENRLGLTGEAFGDWLRKDYQLEMEMCGADYVVAIATAWDSPEGLGRLADALLAIDARLELEGGLESGAENSQSCGQPDIRWKLADAVEAECEALPLTACAGRISGEFIYLYPPGIPIVAPGEVVTEAVIRQVQYYRDQGLPVQGMADNRAEMLNVVMVRRET
ncbi:MAG: aminotransferase class I/II-fold pyridoxal phosphate-dependent enzyme [Lachnospiraceae bacterium]|nr:aminotransferase class I/II-fold pyridoxal phosphate-dependent enzyme [Lachnospiraceae bacterium]